MVFPCFHGVCVMWCMCGTCLCVIYMCCCYTCGATVMGNVCSGSGVSLWYGCLAFVWCMCNCVVHV